MQETDTAAYRTMTELLPDLCQSRFEPLKIAISLKAQAIVGQAVIDTCQHDGMPDYNKRLQVIEAVQANGADGVFQKFVAVLEKECANSNIVSLLKGKYANYAAGSLRGSTPGCCDFTQDDVPPNEKADTNQLSTVTTTEDIELKAVSTPIALAGKLRTGKYFIVETYRRDFEKIQYYFGEMYSNILLMIKKVRIPPRRLRTYLARTFSSLRPHIFQCRISVSSIMNTVRWECSLINCFYFEAIAKHFKLSEVEKEISFYYKKVDSFCEHTLSNHCYVQSFLADVSKHPLHGETIVFKLQWKTDDKTLSDIRGVLRKAFGSKANYVHLVEVQSGSVVVICYAPSGVMSDIEELAKQSLKKLRDMGVVQVTIGSREIISDPNHQKSLQKEVEKPQAVSLRVLNPQPFFIVRMNSETGKSEHHEISGRQSPPYLKISAHHGQKRYTSSKAKLKSSLHLYFGKEKKSQLLSLKLTAPTPAQARQAMLQQNLQEIHLGRASSDSVMEIIKVLHQHKSLRVLDIYDSAVTRQIIRQLSNYLKEDHLFGISSLTFEYCNIVDDDVIELSLALENNTTLHTLDLSSNHKITNEGANLLFYMLSYSKTLKSLELSHCSITQLENATPFLVALNLSYNKLKKLHPLSSTLQFLDLSNCSVTDDKLICLCRPLEFNFSLSLLYLSNNKGITDIGAGHLGKALEQNRSLKYLYLNGTSITTKGVNDLIKHLAHNNTLMYVQLLDKGLKLSPNDQHCQQPLTMEETPELVSASTPVELISSGKNKKKPNPKPQFVSSERTITSGVKEKKLDLMKAKAPLAKTHRINYDKSMNKSHSQLHIPIRKEKSRPLSLILTAPTPAQARQAMLQQNVEEIHLGRASSESVTEIINALYLHSSLRVLDFHDCALSNENIQCLSCCLKEKYFQIISLTLECCNVNDNDLFVLSRGLEKNTTLHTLDISSNCRITDNGAQYLFHVISYHNSLKSLDVSHCSIFEFRYQFRLLVTLNLSYNNLDNLLDLLPIHTALQVLDISSCSVNDDSMIWLCFQLRYNYSLTSLNLSNNKGITDEGAGLLVNALKINENLKYLYLNGTSISAKGSNGLMKSLVHNNSLVYVQLPDT